MSENGKVQEVKEVTISQKYETIYSFARLGGYVFPDSRKAYNDVADFIEKHEKVEEKDGTTNENQ